MNITKTTILMCAFVLCGSLPVSAADHAINVTAGKILTLNLKGRGEMYIGTIPDADGDGRDDQAMCFDVDLFDVATSKRIGTGTDCLFQPQEMGDGIELTGTAFFDLGGNNTLVTRGVTTVHPGSVDSLSDFTHITGAAPSPWGNDILSGTGRFAMASGSVRLSGMVDMREFDPQIEGTAITFDCLFIVTLN